jgi:hypothetical protein
MRIAGVARDFERLLAAEAQPLRDVGGELLGALAQARRDATRKARFRRLASGGAVGAVVVFML